MRDALPPCALQLSAVVFERERGLRQALKTMGMLESGACRSRALSQPVCCPFNRCCT